MPFVFIILGLAVLTIGMRGRATDAMALLASEFTGPNSFVQWFLAIVILGLVGYLRPARPIADAMLGLVLVALAINKGQGFFTNLEHAFQNTQAQASKPIVSGASGGSSNLLQAAGQPSSIGDAVSNVTGAIGATSGLNLDTWTPSGQLPSIPGLPNTGDWFGGVNSTPFFSGLTAPSSF